MWGGELRTAEGTVGYGRGRRATLSMLCLLAVARRASRLLLQWLIGPLCFQFAFRRDGFACLGSAFVAAKALLPRKEVPLAVLFPDELVGAGALGVLCEVDLRTGTRGRVFAIDSSSAGAGACAACVDDDTWTAFYAMSEETGEYVRLA